MTFSITRLNCSNGLFKLLGQWQADHLDCSEINVQHLHIMGSDGWEELNLHANNTQCLLQELIPEIQQHRINQHTS